MCSHLYLFFRLYQQKHMYLIWTSILVGNWGSTVLVEGEKFVWSRLPALADVGLPTPTDQPLDQSCRREHPFGAKAPDVPHRADETASRRRKGAVFEKHGYKGVKTTEVWVLFLNFTHAVNINYLHTKIQITTLYRSVQEYKYLGKFFT